MDGQRTAGQRVGTFDGRAGTRRALAETKNEIVVRDAGVDPDTGESLVELTVRAHKPVDRSEIRTIVPEFAVDRLIDRLDRAR